MKLKWSWWPDAAPEWGVSMVKDYLDDVRILNFDLGRLLVQVFFK